MQMSAQGIDTMQLLLHMTEGKMRVEIANNRVCERAACASPFYSTMAGRRTIRVKGLNNMCQTALSYRLHVLASHGFVSCEARAETFRDCQKDPISAIEALLLLNKDLTGGREHGADPLEYRMISLVQEGPSCAMVYNQCIQRARLLQQFLSELPISEKLEVWLSLCALVRASMACILSAVARSYSKAPHDFMPKSSKTCFDVRVGS